jgi:hypothetical protein
MALEITLLDYADGNIIEQRDKVIWLDVPPGQARDIVEYVDLSSTRQTFGTIPWRYRIIYAKGR